MVNIRIRPIPRLCSFTFPFSLSPSHCLSISPLPSPSLRTFAKIPSPFLLIISRILSPLLVCPIFSSPFPSLILSYLHPLLSPSLPSLSFSPVPPLSIHLLPLLLLSSPLQFSLLCSIPLLFSSLPFSFPLAPSILKEARRSCQRDEQDKPGRQMAVAKGGGAAASSGKAGR